MTPMVTSQVIQTPVAILAKLAVYSSLGKYKVLNWLCKLPVRAVAYMVTDTAVCYYKCVLKHLLCVGKYERCSKR